MPICEACARGLCDAGTYDAFVVRDVLTCHVQACAAVGGPSLEGFSLYATGQPCPMCLAAIHWARLDAYYYSTTYAEAAAIGFDDAAIRDSLAGVIAPMTPGTPWPDEAVRRFFLEYGGKRY